MAGAAHVYDNSNTGRPPRFVLALTQGQVTAIGNDPVPDWVTRLYLGG